METENNYKAPDLARIGHVHLKVSDLKRSLDFYQGLLGFELYGVGGAIYGIALAVFALAALDAIGRLRGDELPA